MQLSWQLTCTLLAVVNAASTITADDIPRKMQTSDNLKAPQRLPPLKLQQSMSEVTASNIPLPQGFNAQRARMSSMPPSGIKFGPSPYIKVNLFTIGPLPTYRTIVNYPHLIPVGKSLTPIGDPAKIADAFIHNYLKMMEYNLSSSYVSKHGIKHAYYKQHVKGIEIANGDIFVHIDKNNQIIAYSETAYKRAHAQSRPWPQLPIDQMMALQKTALAVFYKYINKPITPMALNIVKAQQKDGNAEMFIIKDVPLAVSDVNSKQVYIHDEQGILVPAWEFNIKMRINRFKVHVSIYGQKLLSVIDWACAASYKAVPVGIANIQVEGLKTLINPHLAKVSQSGWHNVNGTHMESTEGNNAAAMIRYDNDNAMFPMSATNDYDFPYYPNVAPHRNAGAAIANAYYVANRMHDIFARYGFHEGAGNYQEKNFDNEGFGGDSIEIYVQAKDAFNNAFFVPSPDGQKGIMQLGLLLDENNNVYDSAFDNDIIIHELTHGLSQRLMGGPRTVDCLNNRESRAMGEGWSDFVAIWARLKETDTDHTVYKIATYVNPNGDRRVPYTLKERGSLSTYKLFNDKGWKDQHDTGVIWGNILYQMHRNIYNTMKKFSNDIANPSIDASNTLVMELIVAAMQVSPCNPTFANGRDALVMADEILTKGKYKCEIYAAFARRGVGVKARRTAIFGKVEEDFSIPNVCKGYSHLLNDPVVF